MKQRFDVAIVGAGMAGASLAAEVAPHASVILLEGESQAGYHATGRSAAFWSETYGGPFVQPLTTASGPILARPDLAFSDHSFLGPGGAIHLADPVGEAALERLLQDFSDSEVALRPLGRVELQRTLPTLRPGWDRGISEPSCADIDVAGLHAAYLRAARRAGAELRLDAQLMGADRTGGVWRLTTPSSSLEAGLLVNAAGAWADPVARLAGERPLNVRPYRRTMLQIAVDPPAPADLPLIIDAQERFYFKPEAGGRLWLSPHDESPCEPCDTAAEEIDVALAIARLELVSTWRVERVERRWAGLRTFAPDRQPVYGFSDSGRGFFWCAGQGGFGIQTAPAAAKLAAALLLGMEPDPIVAGIDPAPYLAQRFRN